MVKVRPFKAVRPEENLASEVASLPYDVLSSEEARELGEKNRYSFLHIDKAEIDLPKTVSPYADQVYEQARTNLQEFLQNNWLKKEAKAGFYLYELTSAGRSQLGLVCVTTVDDYINGAIKKHELTREEKELDRIRHIDACDANTSPIFLTYRGLQQLDEKLHDYAKENAALYDFTSFYEVRHRVWRIIDADLAEEISAAFEAVPALYIADGHHRTESAVKVGLARRKAHLDGNGAEEQEFDYFLSVLFPADELEILDYNRVVNVELPDDFLKKLQGSFELTPPQKEPFKPSEPHEFGLYLDGNWYGLRAREASIPADVIGQLDVSILQEQVLSPLFGIEDVRRDSRIDFVGGIRGLGELERLVDSGKFNAAFALYPPSMEQLLDVADAGKIMPPKSTWFEPKLLSGLFVHELETK
ncbi:hypothetical protein MFLO_14487 [Listeria floridensis FSL S10-1187]|uniref:DUF1015 domain-containing protein n=1 Tax=Listeria floridensis FSL S10-1187 TaxID=1265817 RepID=A0ABP3AUP0_9LIST|nr:DUF1015 family protein [Listeria floridensis]EUJ26170.1 hypothetical protein MFLO_14487 [Listeria floridensis FSL S10-1187]